MTNDEFRTIRVADLRLSTAQLAGVLRIDQRTVRRLEEGTRPISGPVEVIMVALKTKRLPKVPAPR